jgi:hypothetical protein
MPTFKAPMINLYPRDLPRAVEFYSEIGFVETFRAEARSRIFLREQQSFDAIYVFDPLSNQHLALAAEATASSSSGVGTLTIAHTRGSPRLYASSARISASPSILSVFARRHRREFAIEAGSTTWLSIHSACSTRCRGLPPGSRQMGRSPLSSSALSPEVAQSGPGARRHCRHASRVSTSSLRRLATAM